MKWSVISNRALKTLIGCALIICAMAANQIIRDMIRTKHAHVKIECADFAPVDGAGKPEVCK